jgi:hypothetical protein
MPATAQVTPTGTSRRPASSNARSSRRGVSASARRSQLVATASASAHTTARAAETPYTSRPTRTARLAAWIHPRRSSRPTGSAWIPTSTGGRRAASSSIIRRMET